MVGLAATLFSLSAAGLAQGPGEAVLYQESFDSGQAVAWELEPGWQVIRDGDNPVLAGEDHHWARPGARYSGDFRVQFRLKLLRGRIHLVYRMNDAGRYFIGFQESGSDLSKQYWPDTFHTGLTGSSTTHSLGAWHQIEIAGQGATLRFLVDGQPEWEYSDPDPLTGGSFAFETLDDSQAYVDDVIVYGPAPTPTPTPDRRFTWVRTGGPLGGLGYDVRMRPDNPDVMYVTDAKAGVFKSTDGGRTWVPKNNGITARAGAANDEIPVFCLTIDPNNYDIIWAGTQSQRGFFKSTDGGQTWQPINSGLKNLYVGSLFMHPRNPDILLAGTGDAWGSAGAGVYLTTDGGQSWRQTLSVPLMIESVEFSTADPNIAYAGGFQGIYRSQDGGQTWQRVSGSADGWGSPTGAYWNPTRVLSDNRLAAFAADASAYTFAAPDQGDVTVQVTLLFRRAFKELMDQKAWDAPDIVMAETMLVLSK
jgi:photosystem II stability/assembly factor-like uncharacterized protein